VSAVEYIKSDLGSEVDVNRINLWGTSFGGGHVLTLAGTRLRDNITAVVAQVGAGEGRQQEGTVCAPACARGVKGVSLVE
jgi:fermentation-respiration switch protein FrsA (DUF1100 family)